MRRERLRRALREQRAPGEEDAGDRAWALVRAAHRAPAEGRRRGPRARRAAVLALAAVLAVGAVFAATDPGDAVAEWVSRTVRHAVAEPPPRPPANVDRPPGGGRLLAGSVAGPAVVAAGKPVRRLLGAVDQAAWSPRGRFVIAARGPELIAVDLRGRRRWSLAAGGDVRDPRWSPSGYRVAYRAGDELRVVAGDGTGDRALGPAGAAAPAWRPRRLHELAFADRAGRVALLDVDRGRVLWRSRPRLPPRQLSWSADGRRLLVLAARRTYVLSGRGGLVRQTRVPAGARNVAAAYGPDGRGYALVRRSRGGESRILVVPGRATMAGNGLPGGQPRFLFGAPGPIRGLAWSPDGRWLATGVVRADAWVFLRPGPDGLSAARSLADVTARLGGGRFPPVAGWCCSLPPAESPP